MAKRIQRRLVAIVSANVVGCSHLMGVGEQDMPVRLKGQMAAGTHRNRPDFNEEAPVHIPPIARHAAIFVTLLFFTSLLSFNPVHSDNAPLTFRPASIDLKTSSYGGILHDRDGFLWFPTVGRGVIRYDGAELRNFTKGKDGLSGSLTISIAEDSKGVIWIGSLSEGLTQYDKMRNKFTHFKHDPGDVNSLSSNNLPFSPRALLIDQLDRLWVGTQDGGLNRYDPTTATWTRFRHDPDDTNSLTSDAVLALAEDRKGQIWVGTKGGGMDRLDPEKGSWTHFRHQVDDASSLSDNWINAILEDREGAIWIGTKSGGLDRLDSVTGRFHHYRHDPDNPESISSNEVWNLFEDTSGNIWISHPASQLGGLSMFDREHGIFVGYPPTSKDVRGLSSSGIVGVYQQPETGIIWAINGNGAIDKHDPLSSTFTEYQSNPRNPKSLSSNTILPIAEDLAGTIWIGTFDAGLNAHDRETGFFRRFMPDPSNNGSIPNARISSLRVDNEGTLWIGSWGGTLTEFDPERGISVRHHTHDIRRPDSITSSERLKYIVEDTDNSAILWLGTIGGGLDRFDKDTDEFKHFKHDPTDPNSLSHNSITSMFDDGNGFLWIATYGGGLDRFQKNTGKFAHFQHDPSDSGSVSSNTLYEIYRDRAGTLWVTGKGGLSRFDDANQSFRNYSSADGLPSDLIDNLLEDDHGNLWLGTLDAGLIRFDPKSGDHRQFTTGDGLPGNTFFWTSRLKSRDGTMWFGGSKGLVRFHPDKIAENRFIPPVRLTSIRQGGLEMKLGSAAERIQSIELDWRDNYFEFQFAALNFSQSAKNTYAYKLEGRDKDWYYSGSAPFGRYTGLSSGEHTLRLKAANSSGLWNEEGAILRVIVKTPFWETLWFYLTVAAAICAMIFSIVIYVAKLNREVTGRKNSERALRESEERFKEIAHMASDRFWKMDANFCFTSFTDIKKGFPVDPAYHIGITRWEGAGVDPDQDKKWGEHRDDHLAHRPYSSFEYAIILDGKTRYLSASGAPVFDDAGKFVGYHGSATDITERMELEKQLSQAQRLEAVGQLTGGIAHDFNNILGIVMGNLELLLHKAKDRQTIEYADRALEGTKRGADITRKLLASTHREPGNTERTVVNDLIAGMKDLIARSLTAAIDVETDLASELWSVEIDHGDFQDALLNLSLNASHAMPDGGKLAIRTANKVLDSDFIRFNPTATTREFVMISVSDTGVGMTDEVKDKLFEPFFTTKKFGKGSGLGLSMVYGFVERSGGHVQVYSELGVGTTFRVFLPRAMNEARETEQVSDRPDDLPRGNETILVVDDEEVLLDIAVTFLHNLGYMTLIARHGLEALEVLEQNPDIDLLFCDAIMPGNLDGYHVALEAHKHHPLLKVLLTSGFAKKHEEIAGGDGKYLSDLESNLLSKPYNYTELALAVRYALDAGDV